MEIRVATLDKEDKRQFKELESFRAHLELQIAEHRSQLDAFWRNLNTKHGFNAGFHYIKGNAICKHS